MIFAYLLVLAAAFGGGLGALLSHRPGKWRGTVLTGLLLIPLSLGLFVGGLCLRAGIADLTAVFNRFFPDRLSKLAGCGILVGLGCVLGFFAGILRARGPRNYFRAVSGSRLHRLVGLAAAAGAVLAVLGCVVLSGDPPPSPIRLSEVSIGNFSLLTDPDTGEYEDYIELVNTGSEPINIGGCFLSDNGRKRSRFRLPDQTLAPGECVVLWPDGTGKSGKKTGEGIHLNFQLREGETLWLSSPHGTVLDSVTVPKAVKNVSLSRIDGEWILAQGTPGKANDGAAVYTPATLEAPQLSLASGFYDEPQTLTITAAPGCEIRYTLDGAVPTADSLLYEGPLTLEDISDQPNRVLNHPTTTADRSGVITEPVDKGTLIRAVALDGSGARSEVVTAVYFVGGDTFEKYRGRMVLNIVAAPNDLFGNYGIAVTGLDYDRWLNAGGDGKAPYPMYYRRGRLSERDARIFLWNRDGELLMSDVCGVRLQGASSRAAAYKRFRLIARKIYGGSSTFSAEIFAAGPSHSFFTREDSKDVVAQMLLSERGLGGLDAVEAAVFLNGEFYYDCYLRERYDAQYFQNHFGVPEDDLIVISDDQPDRGTAADYAGYRSLMDYIQTGDCSDPAVYAEICRQIDVESFAAFIAGNLYLNNTDWSTYKNYKLWRTRSTGGEGVRDGRWRWLVYDMDACYWTREAFGDAPRASYDLFTYPAPYTEEPFLELPVFRELLQNPDFRALFARTWLELMNVDLSADRWNVLQLENGLLTGFWSEFLPERPQYALNQLIEHIVPGETTCELKLTVSDPAGGTVKLGVMAPAFTEGTWIGAWVTGVPMTLTADPAPGWRFVRWEGADGTEPSITVTPTGDTALTAMFERTGTE